MAEYPNAPLAYVIFAANVRPAAVLGEPATLDRIYDRLRDRFPVREDGGRVILEPFPSPFLGSPGGGARFVDVDQQTAVFVSPSVIHVDTTAYTNFTAFTELLGRIFDVIAEVAPGRACSRLGLRYVDEIRVPEMPAGSPHAWSEWIDARLFPPVALEESAAPRDLAGVIEESSGGGYAVRFSWHTGNGYAVQPVGPLLVPGAPQPGPYFGLDTDSYWQAQPGAPVLSFGDGSLVERVRRLHDPVQRFFERSLTDRLRTEVFGAIR
jgi:uncharacterized protein (TIGR04255 family)